MSTQEPRRQSPDGDFALKQETVIRKQRQLG